MSFFSLFALLFGALLSPNPVGVSATPPHAKSQPWVVGVDSDGFVYDELIPPGKKSRIEGKHYKSNEELMEFLGITSPKEIDAIPEEKIRDRDEALKKLKEIREKVDQLMAPLYDKLGVSSWKEIEFQPWNDRLRSRLEKLQKRGLRSSNGVQYSEDFFQFKDPLGFHVSGRILLPESKNRREKLPAVLYFHFHGGQWALGTDELKLETFRGQRLDFANRLMNQGYAVMAVDAMGHGRRLPPEFRKDKKSGWRFEKFNEGFSASLGLSRSHLVTLSDLAALQLLKSHPRVDANRVATFGFSYGSIRSYRLAAITGPGVIRAAVALGAMPRIEETLKENKASYNINHPFFPGQYRTGLETEFLIFSAAGTPLHLIAGEKEKYSPGWKTIFEFNRNAWGMLGFAERLETVELNQPGFDSHNWYPVQTRDALAFLGRWLKNDAKVRLTKIEEAEIQAQMNAIGD